ncbi:hypothetical protein BDV41DRAFT_3623 [Aspergillus transmontanensis]|uniref:Serine protease n=1 Tax=Aspergillus transmontanensis TaxID=1034304 RepID=A0A5N6WH15_9EURO|nr:hypothetical protein BDV41DRAFT_3623 [Aspergillus transmontanensis]
MFSAKNSSEPIWTMGTGWLIREDLVVTAGHNVYSKTYGGQAKRIKCWIGYRGRNAAKHSSVQHRNALNIVTTASWYNQDGKRQRDVALIQVSAPFEGDLNLFQFRPTDTVVNEKPLTIVGYPGDKYVEDNGNRDYGANMYSGKSNITFNLEETGGMIEYRIDTFGGQSGAPILLGTEEGLIGIGTHCYGAGGDHPLNSGNAIGGLYGNNYEKFRGCLDGVNPRHPTAIGTFRPRFESVVNISAPGDVEESFWDVFKTVAKIGSVVVPSAGAFMGPAGILLGTVTGGILGSLAECASFHESAPNTPLTTPDKDVQDRCIERAQLAEAALQSVIRLGRSLQSDEVFKEMERIWRQSYFQQIPELVNLISPVLTEYGFLIAADHWEKKVEPNPEERESFEGKVSLKPPEDFENSPNAAFVRALYKNETKRIKGIPEGGEESLSQWLTPLIKRAIIIAKPFATKVARKALKKLFEKITKGSAESFPTGNKQKPLVKNIVCRAIIADCALQAIEKLTEEQLQDLTLSPTDAGNEEGIIDSIKTRIQKIGPVALRYAKTTIRQYLPVLLEQLNTRLDPDTKSQKLKTLSTSDFHSNDLVSPFYEEDGNPDAPPVEPRPPASPIIE